MIAHLRLLSADRLKRILSTLALACPHQAVRSSLCSMLLRGGNGDARQLQQRACELLPGRRWLRLTSDRSGVIWPAGGGLQSDALLPPWTLELVRFKSLIAPRDSGLDCAAVSKGGTGPAPWRNILLGPQTRRALCISVSSSVLRCCVTRVHGWSRQLVERLPAAAVAMQTLAPMLFDRIASATEAGKRLGVGYTTRARTVCDSARASEVCVDTTRS